MAKMSLMWTVVMVCLTPWFVVHCLGVSSLNFVQHLDRTFRGERDCSDEDTCRNVTELITSKGFPCEEYSVITEDGFILGLQRIPHGRKNDSVGVKRPAVFLQHGLLDSSATWVVNSAEQSLAFVLADAGFDVWLGNVRGNTYSRQHVKYNPNDARFWAWSWDEMVIYDLPSMLKFALTTSNQTDIFYIGHSQGTLMAFTGFSVNQKLAKHIRAFVALGPVATVGYIRGVARTLADLTPEAELIFKLFGVHEFLPSTELLHFLARTFCHQKVLRYLCEDFIFLIGGWDSRQLNVSRLPVYLSHTPAGTSVQNMVHFAQMVKSKKCQMFDYGNEKLNQLHYNQPYPPVYNISALNVPTFVYYGDQDPLADLKDVTELLSRIHSLKGQRLIPSWDHLDFVWAMDANIILYKEIASILKKQTGFTFATENAFN